MKARMTQFAIAALLSLVGVLSPRAAWAQDDADPYLQYFGNGWMQLPDGMTPTEPVTIELWVRADDTTEFQRVYHWGPTGFCDPSAQVLRISEVSQGGYRSHFHVGCSSEDLNALEETQGSTWQHLALTIDNTGFTTLFVNGVENDSGFPRAGMSVNPGNDLVGAAWSGEVLYASRAGAVDEVRVWDHPRTEGEIQATMNQTLTGDEPGLIAYWNFDDGTADDLSPNGNDGILIGDAVVVSPTPCAATLAGVSVGTGDLVGGDLSSLTASDDQYLRIDGTLNQALTLRRTTCRVDATASCTSIDGMVLNLELAANVPDVQAVISLYNFESQAWDVYNAFFMETDDSGGAFVVPSPSRYVRSTDGAIALRVATRAKTSAGPYEVRIDHVGIEVTEGGESTGGCPGDCDGNSHVDVHDFLCFQGLVTTGDELADCNGDGAVNVFDYLCFHALVAQGCP